MKNQNSDYRNPHKSIHQLHPDNIAFQRWSRVPEDTRWSHWHCVMQVRRQARSRDDRENPRRSYITILSLLPIQRFKFWRQLSASWVCCMFSFTSPEPNVPVYYPPQIQSPLPHQVIQVHPDPDGKLGHGRECTKENGARYSVQLFADCFRLRGKHGEVTCFYSVISSPGGRKECCMLQV